MSQEDEVRFLHEQGLPAGAIHQCLVDLFGDKAIGYSTITRTIRQLNWTAPETPKGRPANFFIDSTILKVLNGDPTVSMRQITQEVNLSASTAFYVVTTRINYIYRRCRLVPHNLFKQQKIDRLRQSYKLLEILQNSKRLCWRFILTGDESWFFYVNSHRKLWHLPESDFPEVARRLVNTPKVMITSF
jgi:hypothetical protein